MAAKTMLCVLATFCAISLGQCMLAGGWSDGNPSEHLSDKVNSTLASHFCDNYGSLTIQSLQKQVVAGMNYRVNYKNPSGSLCSVTIFEQVWTNTIKVTEDTCTEALGLDCASRKRRSLAGGVSEGDVSEHGVSAAVDFAVERYNMMTNSMYQHVRTRIITATKQVVAGVRYELEFEVGESSCRKNDDTVGATIAECPVTDKHKVLSCHASVLEQAWMEPALSMIGEMQPCKPTQEKKRTLGGGGDDHDIGNYGAFQEFKQKYSRQYVDDEEDARRFTIFQDNMRRAAKMQKTEKGTAKYGATKFADVSREEFKKFYTSGGPSGKWDLSHDASLKPAQIPDTPAPAAFDWRNHSAVTEVKNQGMCGSCWAFSVTGNVEGAWAVKKGKLLSLSEQELVDCDKLDDGCNGGLPANAYKEILRLGGLETESKYPYDAKDEACKFSVSDARVYINGSLNISSDEGDMAAWLAQNGPMSIGINAMMMQFYMGGVAHPAKFLCNPEELDHGVLIVGYDIKHGYIWDKPYWIVKNSWGPDWGEKGYYLVYRGKGVCGLNRMVTSAVLN